MGRIYIPEGYKSALDIYKTQVAIGRIKLIFEKNLSKALNLHRVSAPLFVDPATGLNDDLNGVERPVTFDIPSAGRDVQVVQSLAKWKRMALYKYGFKPGEGIYTDMDAIRRDEELDNLHSAYVDQWDWEKIITKEDRTISYLKDTVTAIISAICDTEDAIRAEYPEIKSCLHREISFVTTQELEDMYPALTPKERENTYVQENKTVFIMQIGGKLKSGHRHDGRAPDYDDWNLNGDIMFWHEPLKCAMEISSMGIRVDPETLDRQLAISGCDERRKLYFHKALLSGELPLTIGGGIGQSRLCMLMLSKAHVGEVQVSVWDDEETAVCAKAGIALL